MIIAWTFLVVVLVLIALLTWDMIWAYVGGRKEEGAKAALFILFFFLIASLPAQYIFGG